MNRRQFLAITAGSLLSQTSLAGFSWPKSLLLNPCLTPLPESLKQHSLFKSIWQGLDPAQVWDSHVHLIGSGDAGSGAWFNPNMDSFLHPLLKVQKYFFMNAGCIDNARIDQSYVDRLAELVSAMPAGFKLLLFAFDWFHDEQGRPDQQKSVFHIPDAYAAKLAATYPDKFEWVASIHPYRPDCVTALHEAVAKGARAIKWLPSAMGIDPLSEKCDQFYSAVAESKLPIISHAGREMAVPGGSQDHGNPLRLRRALDHGVKVVVAHCASDGDDIDLDEGENGQRLPSFELFARMMAQPHYLNLLYGDISALTERNRVWAIKEILQRQDWHSRLLNGSDYPLPGIMPLFSVSSLADMKLLDAAAVPLLEEIRRYNPLLFDFAVKRLLRFGDYRFSNALFETRRFFSGQS